MYRLDGMAGQTKDRNFENSPSPAWPANRRDCTLLQRHVDEGWIAVDWETQFLLNTLHVKMFLRLIIKLHLWSFLPQRIKGESKKIKRFKVIAKELH